MTNKDNIFLMKGDAHGHALRAARSIHEGDTEDAILHLQWALDLLAIRDQEAKI